MAEQLPLATVQEAILEYLRGRDDVVVYGAQAVNAYVDEPRMTQDIDLISNRAEMLAEELRVYLHERFHIAVRVRKVAGGRGFRLFQLRKEGNRYLVDIRAVEELPSAQRIADVLIMSPPGLIASKVISYHQRRGRPKSGTDWRDIALLLLEFPELKQKFGEVDSRLRMAGASEAIMEVWSALVDQEIVSEEEDDEFM